MREKNTVQNVRLNAGGMRMTEILGRNIKEIIRENPALETVLADFSIGCTACSLGTCLLKDIVEIHNLAPDQEQNLMRRIAEVVFPGLAVTIPVPPRKHQQKPGETTLCPPLRELVDEHSLIKRLLRILPTVLERMDANAVGSAEIIGDSIAFIKEFADAFHHAKEEKILFSYFDMKSDIIASFCKEHETGRAHVRAAQEWSAAGNPSAVRENLTAYGTLLSEHIKKEDEILYPWMNRSLSDNQVGRLFSDFASVNDQHSEEVKKYAAWIARVELTFQKNTKPVPVS
jgi:hemerythrin-like domain-containing protein